MAIRAACAVPPGSGPEDRLNCCAICENIDDPKEGLLMSDSMHDDIDPLESHFRFMSLDCGAR